MKTIITAIIALLFSATAISQTELIAFKSHSGNMDYFKTDGADNLGGPPIMIDSIVKINDSTIIEYNSYGWGQSNNGPVYTDTVINHPICKIPNVTVDSLKGLYYRSDILFIGFDSVKVEGKKQDTLIETTEEVEENEEGSFVLPSDNSGGINTANPVIAKTSTLPIKSLVPHMIIGLFSFMILFATLMWFKLRKKITVL